MDSVSTPTSNYSLPSDLSLASGSRPTAEVPKLQMIGIIGDKGTGRNHLAACLAGTLDGEKRRHVREHGKERALIAVVVPTADGDPGNFGTWWNKRYSLYALDAVIFLYAVDDHRSLVSLQEDFQPWVRFLRPNLRHTFLVGNKVDLRRDIRFTDRADLFVSEENGRQMAEFLGVHEFLECSALTVFRTLEVEQRVLHSLLPLSYGSCPTSLRNTSSLKGGIIGDKGVGRNTLACRLVNQLGEVTPEFKRGNRVIYMKQYIWLSVVIIPTSEGDPSGPEREWWKKEFHRLRFVILLYAVDDPDSLKNVLGRLRDLKRRFNKTWMRPRIYLVGNKSDLRHDEIRGQLVSPALAESMATEYRATYFECSAFRTENVPELRNRIMADQDVSLWC